MIVILRLMLLLALLAPSHAGWGRPSPREGTDRIGREAPRLDLQQWIHSPPLDMEDLRGKVVLLRWWTDTCPFCSTSAPALNGFQRKYGAAGLQVVGIFHPKPPGEHGVEQVRRTAERLGFTFPVGLDWDWKALERWWLSHARRGWTSVSFLVDKKGIIRYVHPGGEYHQGPGGPHWQDHAACRRDYREIETIIQRLLAE